MEIFDGNSLVDELETAYRECEEYVAILQGKNIEEITEADIEKVKKVLDKIPGLEDRIMQLKKEVEAKATKVKDIEKQYPLVDRSDIISKEEYELLQVNKGVIEKFEDLQEKAKDKSDDLRNISYAYNRHKEKKRATELVCENAPAKAVWMTVDCNDPGADFYCLGYKVGEQRPISIKLMNLMQETGWPESVKSKMRAIPHHIDDSAEVTKRITFKEYAECDLEKKQKLREYEEKINEIANSENAEYDKLGQFEILGITMNMTQREVAMAGILPDEVRWYPERQIEPEQSTIDSNLGTLDEISGIEEKASTIDDAGTEHTKKGKITFDRIKEAIDKVLKRDKGER